MTRPCDPHERRFGSVRINVNDPVDQRHMHLMFRGRMAVLRGFYVKQHRNPYQPMPEREVSR